MTHEARQIEIIFIINGEDFPVKSNVSALLLVSVEQALILSGNSGRRDPREWEVRNAAGVLLEVDRLIEDLNLRDGTRLFLSLRVGAGGALP